MRKSEIKPLPDAPTTFHGWPKGPLPSPILDETLYNAGGGMIVAHTGRRTIAVSRNGYTWSKITPGQ